MVSNILAGPIGKRFSYPPVDGSLDGVPEIRVAIVVVEVGCMLVSSSTRAQVQAFTSLELGAKRATFLQIPAGVSLAAQLLQALSAGNCARNGKVLLQAPPAGPCFSPPTVAAEYGAKIFRPGGARLDTAIDNDFARLSAFVIKTTIKFPSNSIESACIIIQRTFSHSPCPTKWPHLFLS